MNSTLREGVRRVRQKLGIIGRRGCGVSEGICTMTRHHAAPFDSDHCVVFELNRTIERVVNLNVT